MSHRNQYRPHTTRRQLLASTSCGMAALALPWAQTTMAHEQAEHSAQQLTSSKRVQVIAHRGASASAPENTLPAFKLGMEAGADLIELDYYHSADGVPVVFHDKTLNRTTTARSDWKGSKPAITSRTWQQLQQLDAGKWFDPKFAGTRIPSLSEALATIQAGSVTLIERKGGDAKTLVRLLEEQQLIDHVVVQAFDWDFLADCHRLAPSLVLGALGSKRLGAAELARVNRTGAQAVGWKHSDITATSVKSVHASGRKLWVYTVNDAKDMRRLIELGVDGLITDQPALARKVVDSLG